MVPQFLNQWIGITFLEQNRDYRQVSFLIRVHQVGHHVVTFAMDLLLAGSVKVELFQLVCLPTY